MSLADRYDKVKIVLKEIIHCQYTACMNPTAGSFNITPRMQRQFVTLAVQMPPPEIVRSVYFQILDGHLNSFDADVAKMSNKLVDATIELHRNVSERVALPFAHTHRHTHLCWRAPDVLLLLAFTCVNVPSNAYTGDEQLPPQCCQVPLPVQLA